MKVFNLEVEIPGLYSQDGRGVDATVYLHLTSISGWHWYLTEFDGDDTFFGYVVGFEKEWGYVSYLELQELLNENLIRLDVNFSPKKLKELL